MFALFSKQDTLIKQNIKLKEDYLEKLSNVMPYLVIANLFLSLNRKNHEVHFIL